MNDVDKTDWAWVGVVTALVIIFEVIRRVFFT